jgi:hypothetical protein
VLREDGEGSVNYNLGMAELVAVFCSGVFFGAALYITVAQHPAALEAGVSFASRFFPPMYRRAAPMQVGLALIGAGSGLWAWWRGSGLLWSLAALLLFASVPVTLVWIKPVTDRLLAAGRDPETAAMEPLLRRWGVLHGLRTVLSGLGFVLMLWAFASG